MEADDDFDDGEVERALAGGIPQRVGRFRFYFADERWEWSPEVERIHGYEPGTASPTTEVVLSHKHADDYAHVAATIDDIRRTHEPFSARHRIITVQGDIRQVIVIGEALTDENGDLIGTQGFYIDVTPAPRLVQAALSEAVADFTAHRSVIEQAKGVLMFVYKIDSTAAFELLRWRSQETNVKLRSLAEQLMAALRELPYGETLPTRLTFDSVLLSVHHRVRDRGA